MKKITISIAALWVAATGFVSCNKETPASVKDGVVKMEAIAEEAVTKVTFGELTSGKRPITWNDAGEAVELWEFVDETKKQAVASTSYSVDTENARKAKFNFELAAAEEGSVFDYVAVYPASSARTNGTLPTPTSVSYALSVTATDLQTPTATGPDQNWMVMTAVANGYDAQQSSINLAFEHQTAYGRMTFKNFPELATGETLDKITVTCPTGKYFTGRRWYDYKTGEITPYSESAQKPTFGIDPSNITPNTTAFDIWFSVLPVALVTGETLTVTAETSANTYKAEIVLSKALEFNKGEISSFGIDWSKYVKEDTKVLSFDFSASAYQEGWPTAQDWATGYGNSKTCTYRLNGTDYQFILAEPGFAQNCKIYWNTTKGYFFGGKYRYLGLPKISGYTLKTVDLTVGVQVASSSVAIMDHIYSPSAAADPDSYAVAAQAWNVAVGTVMTYDVSATNPDQQYYVYIKNPAGGTGISKVQLTYKAVE